MYAREGKMGEGGIPGSRGFRWIGDRSGVKVAARLAWFTGAKKVCRKRVTTRHNASPVTDRHWSARCVRVPSAGATRPR